MEWFLSDNQGMSGRVMSSEPNPNIHADLEVSDSNEEEEGEIFDDWD